MICRGKGGGALGNVNRWINQRGILFTSLSKRTINQQQTQICDQLICVFVSVTKDFQLWGLEPEFLQIMR